MTTAQQKQSAAAEQKATQPGATTPLEKKIARNLAKARAAKGYSQGDLSKRTNLSTSYLSMMERGIRVPTIATLETLAKALNVRPPDMLR
jgi:ribosome-binding protein aMBF1 (putative translation factor)